VPKETASTKVQVPPTTEINSKSTFHIQASTFRIQASTFILKHALSPKGTEMDLRLPISSPSLDPQPA
jgi:hypothetical protein